MWIRVINSNEIAEIAEDKRLLQRLNDPRLGSENTSEGWMTVEYSTPSYDALTHKAVQRVPVVGLIDNEAVQNGKWVVLYDYAALAPVEVQAVRDAKKQEIENAMLAEASGGIVNSALGFPINCRRSAFHNDLQNFGVAIKRGISTVRDANGVEHTLTVPQLQTIETEMEDYGLSLYQKKWILFDQIDAAVTQAELDAVVW